MLFRVATNVSTTRPTARRRGNAGEARSLEHNQLISEELFRDALARELRRADRFEEAVIVLLITVDLGRLDPSSLAQIFTVLSPSQSGADVTGWFKNGSVLGLIRSVDTLEPVIAAESLGNALRREFSRCLTPDQATCCSIQCEAYSSRGDATAPEILVSDSQRGRLRHTVSAAAKRLLDIVGSACGLLVLAPMFLCVAALVKMTSKGPVFFRQQRIGEAGRPFTMFKFRTMQLNCDPKIHQQYVEGFIQSGQAVTPGGAPFKIVNDPRLTPCGDFLRKSSLDEFPQLWNVLRGEMSLVGPRPPLPYEVARYKRWHRRRVLEAKPGMTGLWQVTGRSRTTFDDMVRLDLRYASNRSVWADLKILLATPWAVLSGKGAR